jgi:hypothetical protein
MTFDARDKYISSFCDDDQTRVFLISLKAGGVALNLTVASAVFIMDPWSVPRSAKTSLPFISCQHALPSTCLVTRSGVYPH